MQQERVDVAGSPVEAVESPVATGREHVLTLLSRLEVAPHDEALCTSFNQAVVELAKQPSAEVFELLSELADRPWLTRARDANGWPCRAAVLWSWAELGYPWALELSAEDLAYVRENAPGTSSGWLTLSFVLAAISGVLNGALFFLLLAALLASSMKLLFVLLPLPFGAMLAHAIATLVATSAAQAGRASAGARLKTLSYAGWVALFIVVVLGLLSTEAGVVASIASAPLLASSLGAGIAARGQLKR